MIILSLILIVIVILILILILIALVARKINVRISSGRNANTFTIGIIDK